jgi:hypothetical protein
MSFMQKSEIASDIFVAISYVNRKWDLRHLPDKDKDNLTKPNLKSA